jgi:hypothetical protein
MLKAIDCATFDLSNHSQMPSKTDGLRTIKSFERVNKIAFDPCNERHLNVIKGMAGNERFFINMHKLLNGN